MIKNGTTYPIKKKTEPKIKTNINLSRFGCQVTPLKNDISTINFVSNLSQYKETNEPAFSQAEEKFRDMTSRLEDQMHAIS